MKMIAMIYKYNRDIATHLLCNAILHYGPDIVEDIIKGYPSIALINICICAARRQQINQNDIIQWNERDIDSKYILLRIIAKYGHMDDFAAMQYMMATIKPYF